MSFRDTMKRYLFWPLLILAATWEIIQVVVGVSVGVYIALKIMGVT